MPLAGARSAYRRQPDRLDDTPLAHWWLPFGFALPNLGGGLAAELDVLLGRVLVLGQSARRRCAHTPTTDIVTTITSVTAFGDTMSFAMTALLGCPRILA